MPRDAAKVRQRLQAAALELYQERGFDATTTGDIAARAGVTERTFFRHFPDKKDVLFDGQETLRDLLTAGVRAAPADAAPLDVLLQALLGIVPLLEANRPIAAPRAAIIRATPALRERAGAKTAWLSAAVSAELQQRGVPAPVADLAVDVSMAAFHRAAAQWFEDPAQDVRSCVERAFGDLRALAAALPQGLLPAPGQAGVTIIDRLGVGWDEEAGSGDLAVPRRAPYRLRTLVTCAATWSTSWSGWPLR
jgi:AcrR family transcriptional regulator